MLCKRRFSKLGLKQRLIIGGVVFVAILILLSNRSYDGFNLKHPNKHKSKDVKRSEKLPHYPDRGFNAMDREMAQMHPYLNDPGELDNPDVSEEDLELKMDKKKNDFMGASAHEHIGHVLLSSSKVVEQIRLLLLRISSDTSSIDDVEDFLIDTADLLQESDIKSKMSCKDIDNIQLLDLLDYTSKKLMYRGQSADVEVAVKSPGKDLEEKAMCMQKFNDLERCTAVMNFQVVREILLHSVLLNGGIVKMLGYCIRGDEVEALRKGVILVTEMGSKAEAWNLEVFSWKYRFKVLYSLAELLVYLENSPLGSLRLQKLAAKDFVQVKDSLKLVDLDELRIGEKSCAKREDCFAYNADVGISCKSGECRGLNARLNLKKVYDVFLYGLLRQEPRELKMQVYNILEMCENMQMTPRALLRELQQMAKVKVKEPEKKKDIPLPGDSQEVDGDSREQRRGHEAVEEQVPNQPIGNYGYLRVNNSNFPGMYDFVCPNSRVTWGCVLDSHGLTEGMQKCDSIRHCKALVAFTKYPEANSLFTIVLKSAFDQSPIIQDGITLFLKKSAPDLNDPPSQNADSNKGNMREREADKDDRQPLPENKMASNDDKTGHTVKPGAKSDDPRQCSQQIFRDQKKKRRSAEKRLMTHIGMKGLEEKMWSNMVKEFPVEKMYPLISSTVHQDGGGQFIARFSKSNPTVVKKALVMALTGPDHYHVAHFVAYYVDRLLGLYHIPPSRVVELPPSTLEDIQNEPWFEPYKAHLNKDGFLSAVATVPKPEAITQQDILIPRPNTYVTSVVSLSKKQRIQMEYLLVMWLSRMPQPSKGHVGYNGHLIHFESSRALQQTVQSWILNYFYNCQFPKSVVQVLNCFRCGKDSNVHSQVCSFGPEVMTYLHGAGIPYEDIKLGDREIDDLKVILNDAASKVLYIMDKCAHLFGKSAVFY